MANNAQTILRLHFEEWSRSRGAPDPQGEWVEDESAAFEQFTADAVLRDRGLTTDDLDDANVDGALDGGLDSVFVFLHNEVVREDSPYLSAQPGRPAQGAPIELFAFQTKLSAGQSTTQLALARDTITRLSDLTLEDDESAVAASFNEEVRARFSRFRKLVKRHITANPRVSITFVYATGSSQSTSAAPYLAEVLATETALGSILPGISVVASVRSLSAPDLSRLGSRTASYDSKLRVSEVVPVSNGFIALATLNDYFDFITSDDGDLLQHLFDENVRAF